MHEHCDGCGAEFPVLGIVFTGHEYLCSDCLARKVRAMKIVSATTHGGSQNSGSMRLAPAGSS